MTADIVVVRERAGEREVLLVLRGQDPYTGCWALPGGFLDAEETPEHAARRELEEETSLAWAGPLRLMGVYGEPGRDPRGWTISCVYLADVGDGALGVQGGDDAAEARWHRAGDLPPLAFDHDLVVSEVLSVLDAPA